MERRTVRENRTHPFATALLLNAAALLLALVCFRPFFEENDDAIIAMLAEGFYGERTPYLVYPNILFGRLLVFLYEITAKIRWYSVIQYFVLFLAMTVFTWLLVRGGRRSGETGGVIWGVLFVSCFFYEAYVAFQYTKAAMLIAMSGYLLIFHGLRGFRKGAGASCRGRLESVLLTAGGCGLAFFGGLLRISSFYLATAFAFGCGLYELYKLYKEGKGPVGRDGSPGGRWDGEKRAPGFWALRPKVSALVPYVAAFGLLFAAVLAAEVYNASAYEKDQGWKAFREFNGARTELTDYRYDMLQYDKYGELLQSVGVTENDAYSWLTWQIGDSGVLTTAKIGEILDLDIERELGMKYVRDLGGNVAGLFTGANAFAVPLLLIALYILFFTGFRNKWICLYSAGVLLASLLYYQYCGRWNHRVVTAAFAGAFFCVLYYMGTQGQGGEKREKWGRALWGLAVAAAVLLNGALLTQNRAAFDGFRENVKPQADSLLAYTLKNRDSLYVVDAFADQHSYDFTVFTPGAEGCFANRVSAGSWLSNSPVFSGVLSKFGATNPYLAVLELENAYFVDVNNIENKRLMLEEHHGEGGGIAEEMIYQTGDFKIYAMKKE